MTSPTSKKYKRIPGNTMESILSALPTGQFVFVAIAGSCTLLTALYLLSRGYVAPLASVAIVAFVLYITALRVRTTQPSSDDATQFTVFRDMEPEDQTRVNPWVGFLQEDVYANRTGPIGTFVGNDDYVKNAPLYPFT